MSIWEVRVHHWWGTLHSYADGVMCSWSGRKIIDWSWRILFGCYCLSSLSSVSPGGGSWKLDSSYYQEWIYSLKLWGENGEFWGRDVNKAETECVGVTEGQHEGMENTRKLFPPNQRNHLHSCLVSSIRDSQLYPLLLLWNKWTHAGAEPRGKSRDEGDRDRVLLWVPFVPHWNLCWFGLYSLEMCQDISLTNPSLSVCQVSTATQPKSFELVGRGSWCAPGCSFASGFSKSCFETQAVLPAFFQTMKLLQEFNIAPWTLRQALGFQRGGVLVFFLIKNKCRVFFLFNAQERDQSSFSLCSVQSSEFGASSPCGFDFPIANTMFVCFLCYGSQNV